jgi:hypothetical protein
LQELVQAVDAEAQDALQEAVALLQAILQTPNPEQFITENAHMLDDAFMAVLTANLQNAEQSGNLQASARLRQIYDQVIAALQSQMSPELRFINQVLSAPSADAAEELIKSEGLQFGQSLIDALDALTQSLEVRGDNPVVVERIRQVRAMAAGVVS